ncbi:MAG TPA: zinc-binding alcohol dehydrogenase family protein [Terriglobia bacterium]|nr:zinc-binding alcohol dehydrogenase family protein [Terriglobia bacterium]
MDAAVLHALGQAPRCEPFPEPVPRQDEVLVYVRAASLKPVDKQMASGAHFAHPREFPVVCGMDGVGTLDDGSRAFFGGPRSPYGAMAQRTVVARSHCMPVPQGVDDLTAAAIANPGVSAWMTLAWRAGLKPREKVLILGATGVTGKLAIQISKLLGAGRVVAVGRNEDVLGRLHDLGADATIRLGQTDTDLTEAFTREAGEAGFNVIIDYLWGRPTEVLLSTLTRKEFALSGSETRLIEVGESAGPSISLPASVLRSRALTILGSAGIPPFDLLAKAFQDVMKHAARGTLRIDVEPVPLADIEDAWRRDTPGRRLVVVP